MADNTHCGANPVGIGCWEEAGGKKIFLFPSTPFGHRGMYGRSPDVAGFMGRCDRDPEGLVGVREGQKPKLGVFSPESCQPPAAKARLSLVMNNRRMP